MPQYEITDPRRERTLVVEGPTPPSDADIDMLFAEDDKTRVGISAAPERSLLERLSDSQGDIGPLLKPLTGLANGVSNLVRQIPGVMSTPALERFTRPATVDTAPRSAADHVGKAVVDTAAYGIPGGKAAQLTAGRGLLTRAAGQAAAAGAVGAAQEGDISGAAVPAVVAGALPVVGAGVRTAGGYLKDKVAPSLVQSAIKPTVTALKTQAGASMDGLQFGANRAANTLLKSENQWTARAHAENAARRAEAEIQAALAGPSPQTYTPILDLPARVPQYLSQLEKKVGTQILPEADLAAVNAARQNLLQKSPLAQTVTRPVLQPPSFGSQMAGNTAAVPAQQSSQAIRANVTPAEGLSLARGTGRQATKRAYGELKSADVEAEKTLERAVRDSVKDAVPAVKDPLRRQGEALQVRDILDRMALRDGNRDVANPMTMFSPGSVLGQILKSQQLRGGYASRNAGQALIDIAAGSGDEARRAMALLLAAGEQDK